MEHIPIRLPDAQLLDFNRSHLPDGDTLDTDALLAEYGDLYRNHLAIAISILNWRQRLRGLHSEDVLVGWTEGEGYACAEIAGHLRQGDFLPHGEFLGR
ncbi:MAG: hypothetical protein JWM76_1080 [Pseudonocardiales bacterium]|nr:hypothetical protein [Pseudonocardiales bacterium]